MVLTPPPFSHHCVTFFLKYWRIWQKIETSEIKKPNIKTLSNAFSIFFVSSSHTFFDIFLMFGHFVSIFWPFRLKMWENGRHYGKNNIFKIPAYTFCKAISAVVQISATSPKSKILTPKGSKNCFFHSNIFFTLSSQV